MQNLLGIREGSVLPCEEVRLTSTVVNSGALGLEKSNGLNALQAEQGLGLHGRGHARSRSARVSTTSPCFSSLDRHCSTPPSCSIASVFYRIRIPLWDTRLAPRFLVVSIRYEVSHLRLGGLIAGS